MTDRAPRGALRVVDDDGSSVFFARTTRALAIDDARGHDVFVAIVGAAFVLAAVWLTKARVPLSEVSEDARLEAGGAPHAVQIPVTGSVLSISTTLGTSVKRGDVLLVLDATPLRIQRDQAAEQLRSVGQQIDLLEAEIEAIGRSQIEARRARSAAIAEARAQARAGRSRARMARTEASALEILSAKGVAAAMDAAKAHTESVAADAFSTERRLTITRLERESARSASDDDAAMARLRRDLSSREEERATLTAETEKLQFEIDRHVVRAPIDGTIGDISNLRVGSVAMTGDRCATIVPAGELTIVAGFARGTAVGRIHPGQRARVRLTGFSWVQYGSLEAVVTRVASEASSDRVRVELSLRSQTAHRIPIQNGLTATVDVELERVAPLGLILRAVGRWIEAA